MQCMELKRLSDENLLALLKRLVDRERRAAAESLACMAELERRRLLPDTALPSLFLFCVKELRMSEETAFRRVRAVKAANRCPEVYSLLNEGTVNFTTLSMIQPHLDSKPELLHAIRDKSKREVELLIARFMPEKPRPDAIRVVVEQPTAPPPVAASESQATEGTASVPTSAYLSDTEPTARERVLAEIRFQASGDFLAALERLRTILWHRFPNGRLEDVLMEPILEYLTRRDPERPRRSSNTRQSVPTARRPPAALSRAVRRRDGNRCAFVDAAGRRCDATRTLEIDHVVPWALGGRSDDPANLRLLCRAHNQAEARRFFALGPLFERRDD
jgi:5-methylcytosine-specific restriction endonuclease McrA